MAVKAVTKTPSPFHRDNAVTLAWASMANGDSGEVCETPSGSDRSVQFTGTFGSGGTVLLEGSNDGTNYVTLTDPQGNAISKTAAGIEQIEEITRYVRPRVSAGDGTTAIVATMIVRSPR